MQKQDKKPCSKCGEIKTLDCFNKKKSSKNGLYSQCRSCVAIYNQTDKVKAANKAREQTSERKAYNKAYRESDRGKAAKKAYAQSDKGKSRLKAYAQSDKRKSAQRGYERSDKTKAYRRAYSQTRKAKDAQKAYRQSSIIKIAAHKSVVLALKLGSIIKPDDCEDCHTIPSKLNGHHDDYSKPLVVRWMCQQCHSDWHTKNGPGLNSD